MPVADDDTVLPFSLPNICKKKVTAAFDGGTISSDGGVFLVAGTDKRLGLMAAPVSVFPDRRDPSQIRHSIADILRERIFAIACGHPDGNDLDSLRADPAFKMACGRLPRQRRRSGFATNLVTVGEHTEPPRADPHVAWDGGFMVPRPRDRAKVHRAGHRRPSSCADE